MGRLPGQMEITIKAICKHINIINSKHNKINGNGYIVWLDANEKYVGQFTDNLQNGMGIHIWYEAKGEQKYLRNRYVGEMRNGMRHGYGVFFYSNGGKYEGQWDFNLKHGFGCFTFHDGSQYIGKFYHDRMTDYNSSGIYAPTNLGKIERNISTATSQAGGKPKPRVRALQGESGFKPIIEEGAENAGSNQVKPTQGNVVATNLNLPATTNNVSRVVEPTPVRGADRMNTSTSQAGGGFANNLGKIVEGKREDNDVSMIANNAVLNNNPNRDINESILASNLKSNVISKRVAQESETNLFKTSMDITDIIECEPYIEQSLKEVENILLRHLTEMKQWYKLYSNRDGGKGDFNDFTSVNASIAHNNIESLKTKDNFMGHQTSEKHFGEDLGKDKDEMKGGRKNSLTNLHNINSIETIYNNDLGFALEMKDMWKFLRESNILTSEFSIAQFNRIFFRGNKNYIEMFMCPEDLDEKYIYDYIYLMINKAKSDFGSKYQEKLQNFNLATNVLLNSQNSFNEKDANFKLDMLMQGDKPQVNYKQVELEINFDIHNKHQVVLQRQFYEAIVRIAYLKYFHMPQALSAKLNWLIDSCIKTNSQLKRQTRKSTTESSINVSVLDLKVKNFELAT